MLIVPAFLPFMQLASSSSPSSAFLGHRHLLLEHFWKAQKQCCHWCSLGDCCLALGMDLSPVRDFLVIKSISVSWQSGGYNPWTDLSDLSCWSEGNGLGKSILWDHEYLIKFANACSILWVLLLLQALKRIFLGNFLRLVCDILSFQFIKPSFVWV